MANYNINRRLYNGKGKNNISNNNIINRSNIYKFSNFTGIMFFLLVIFYSCGVSLGMDMNVNTNIDPTFPNYNNPQNQRIVVEKKNDIVEMRYNNNEECITLKNMFSAQAADKCLDDTCLINNYFANIVYAVECNEGLLNDFKESLCNIGDKIDFIKDNKPIVNNSYLFALVYVNNDINKHYLIYCENANSIKINGSYYGLFQESKATDIEILKHGSNVINMNNIFKECSLTNLKFYYSLNIGNVSNNACYVF